MDCLRVDAHSSATIAEAAKLRGRGRIVIGPFATIEDGVLLDTGSRASAHIEIGPRSKLKYGAVVKAYDGWVRVGSRTSVGEYSVLAGHGGLDIGSAVILAGHCYLSAAEHNWTGTVPIRFQGETARGITVEDGCWLGARVVVLDGICIGEQTIVGAGSVVTKDLPAYKVCVGTPCRVVRSRNVETI